MDAGQSDLVQLQPQVVDLEEELERRALRAKALPIPIALVGAAIGYGLSLSTLSAVAEFVGALGLVAAVWYLVSAVGRLHEKREELDRLYDELDERLALVRGPASNS